MKNMLQEIAVFLGGKFALVEKVFATKDSVADVSGRLDAHEENGGIHKTSAQIRGEITEADIPASIARDQEVRDGIAEHDGSGEAHADLRNGLENLGNGSTIAGRSEYAGKLGTPTDSYTKAQLDAKINKHIRNVTYNAATATFVFAFEDGTATEIDTPLESTVKDGRFDAVSSELVLVLVSGQEIRIPAAGLVKVYTGQESPTMTTQINSAGEVRADLKQGVVDMVHLSETLRNAINDHLTKTGDTRNNVTTFAEASMRANIVSGETQATMFGKIRKWFTDLRAMAFKDGVNLSVVPATTTVAVMNDCGSEAVLPAATAGSAGVMTAADRQKMTQLFDGTMLDSTSPAGYHKHNYLELSDLPPTVEMCATSYAEFKAAVKALQAVVAKGKYGKIIVTGTCEINDNTEFDLMKINIECRGGGFRVTSGPLRVRNADVESLYFDTGTNYYTKGYEVLRVWCNVWGGSKFGTLKIDRCAYKDATPQITISGNNTAGNIYCDFDRILGYTKYRNEQIPIVIQCADTVADTVIKINSIERMGIDNEIDSVKIVSSNFDKIHLALSKDVLVENIDQLKHLSPIAGELFDMRSREVSVPTPSTGVRTPRHVLNALGQWVEVQVPGESVNAIDVNGTTYTQSGGKITLPAYPVSLPANGGTADVANKLSLSGVPSIFHWKGQAGQPNYLFGGNEIGNMYVYNPSNFIVSHANTAGNADTVDGLHAAVIGKVENGKLASYDSNGYFFAKIYNDNWVQEDLPINSIMYKIAGDNYIRNCSLSHLKTSLGSMPASDVSAWAKAGSKPSYNMSEISDAIRQVVNGGTVTRKVFLNVEKSGNGYVSRVALGLSNPSSAFSPVLLSVGTNDSGTSWVDYVFNTNGRITSPAGTFALTSEFTWGSIAGKPSVIVEGDARLSNARLANGGNADTVDGSHAWRLQSVQTDGSPYGANAYDIQSRYDANGMFRLEVVGCADAANYTDKVRVGFSNYANTAGNADTVDGYHAAALMPNVFNQATAPTSGMKKGDIWVNP